MVLDMREGKELIKEKYTYLRNIKGSLESVVRIEASQDGHSAYLDVVDNQLIYHFLIRFDK